MALTTLKLLNAEIKLLEARKKLVEKRDGEVPKALAVLQNYAKVLTEAQRRKVAQIIGLASDGAASTAHAARTPKAARSPLKGRKLGKVVAKYQLPSGETWAGRGLTPRVFTAWAKSAQGKAWIAANPGERFPAAGAAAKAPAKATRKAGKVVKKAAKKPAARKAAKKAVKKAVRKVSSKPANRAAK
ncbi:H-NS family nucleoid-associated regulatory protein [Stenotrophomonas tumulicola]|uniref:H-NS histone family protein n=1 Tax=Stenotrophomonas tumulicola TaxID=1685415 RepID=A0A7W3FJI9_9GAMM|nr:H-NS family nucleoid-associated regulatory protein [Stenotrophomonas tumulicola]MBA8680718.1 H-NS histone family protein [Stenotrophomonas tumulicola]